MKMRKLFTDLLVICSFLQPVFSQVSPPPRAQRPSAARSGQPAFMQKLKSYEETPFATKAVMKNGLTVIVHEFHAFPVVSITSYVRGGYAFESAENAGVSDVLARVFFRGTTNRSGAVVGKEIKAMGATAVSEASYDQIRHELICPAPQWKRGLEIQSDSLINLALDPAEVRRAAEGGLYAAAVRKPDSRNEGWIGGLEMELPRGSGGPSRTGSGTQEPGPSLDMVKEYFKSRYSATDVTVVIAGDITASDILAEAVKFFEKARSSPSKAAEPAESRAGKGFRYMENRGYFRNPQVVFTYRVPSFSTADYPGLEVLSCILGTGEASVLSQNLRMRKRLALDVSSALVFFAGSGFLQLNVEAEAGNIDKSEIGLLTEVELLRHQEPDDEAMERAFSMLEQRHWSRLQSVSGRSRAIFYFESQGDWKKIHQYLQRIRQVKPAEISRLAAKYLQLGNCSLLENMPVSAEARGLTSETALQTFQGLIEPATEQAAAEHEKESIPAVKMPEAPPAYKLNEIRYAYKKASVLRGPEILMREDHSLPLLHLGFFYPGGRLMEKKDEAGLSLLLINAILAGTKEKGPREVRRQFELYGAEVTPVAGGDFFGVKITALSRNIEGVLELLADILQNPALSEEELSKVKEGLITSLKPTGETSRARADDLLMTSLFPDFPYSWSAAQVGQNLSRFTPEAVREWHARNIHNRKPVVIIIGDTQGTTLAGFFVRRFSGSRFQDLKIPDGFPRPLEAPLKVEEKCDSGPDLAVLGFQAPPEGDEDSYALEVMQNLMAGEGGRLTEQLRDTQGTAIEALFQYLPNVKGGVIVAGGYSAAGKGDKTRESIQAELSKFADNPFLYRDFRSALNGAITDYWISQQNRHEQILELARSLIAGRGLDAVLDHVSRLQDVKQEDLPELARRIFSPARSVAVRLVGRQ
jgi:zinc protease